MNLLFAIALAAPGFVIQIAEGKAQVYAPGKMDDVVAYQIGRGKIPPDTDPVMAICFSPDCSLIGYDVYVEWPDGLWTGPHRIVDCSKRSNGDLERNNAKGLAIEVSWEFALDHSIPKGRYRLPLDGPLGGVKVYMYVPDAPAQPM